MKRTSLLALLSPLCFACASGNDTNTEIALDVAAGKADLAGGNAILMDVRADSSIRGHFYRDTEIYGYVFEARKGARVSAELTTVNSSGEPITSVMAIHSDFVSPAEPGPMIASGADAAEFAIEQDGKYLVTFASFDITEVGGHFRLDLQCHGNKDECQRVTSRGGCDTSSLYFQAPDTYSLGDGDLAWTACEVRAPETELQNNTAKPLSIGPGVQVEVPALTIMKAAQLKLEGTISTPVSFRGTTLRLSSVDNVLRFAEFDETEIIIQARSGATIEDSTIVNAHAGIQVDTNGQLALRRSLIKDSKQAGILILNAEDVIVEDSVIRDNVIGVALFNTARDRSGTTSCSDRTRSTISCDPVITHSDIINNGRGVVVHTDGSLLQIERSNIEDNEGFGVEIQARSLSSDSFFRSNNITNNGPEEQLRSYHRTAFGSIDLDGNYWGPITDLGALAESFDARCDGTYALSSFEVERIADAGPRMSDLSPAVQQQAQHAE